MSYDIDRDAARYRWLRERANGLELDPEFEGIVFGVPLKVFKGRKVHLTGSDVDSVIDAAMQEVH